MSKKINWLHFSDLHYGQKGQNILLPKLKKELFRDLERLKEEIGKFDVVFFTGDLTFSGKKEEFDELNVFLNELWKVFNQMGCNPYLIAIPGNHDLLRPDLRHPIVKVLRRYSHDKETKAEFWEYFQEAGYSELLNQCFVNFTSWYNDITIPKPDLQYGMIPGDISAVMTFDELKLKVVGLNTAFLEFTNEDYKGKLAINPLQIHALTSSDPLTWANEADISLLLTHHDMKWYEPESLGFYNSEINPPETYFNHLCGHLHEPSMDEYGQIGSSKRRVQLAPSLFGLEKINDVQNRIHGYIAGSYEITSTEIIENIYPRTAHQLHGGGSYRIAEDYGFELNKRSFIEVVHLFATIPENKEEIIHEVSETKNVEAESLSPGLSAETQGILDSEKKKYNGDLEQVPRVQYSKLPQHVNIRLIEQEEFIKHLSNDNYCWLITDWSLSDDEFIGSVCERLNIDNRNNFIVNCEDAVSDHDLLEAFNEQAGMSLANFCNKISGLDNHLLVFNQLQVGMYRTPNAFLSFIKLIKSITDFCPNTFVILISRQAPDEKFEKRTVKLSPLDAPEIKTYIESHPNSEEYLTRTENLEKLVSATGGLPNKIDKFMSNLKYASFDELIELQYESANEIVDFESIPKALQQTLSLFSDSTNKQRLRSFKLLKILTILSYGETFNNLKRFISTEPISLEQIGELVSLSLLEIIVKNRVFSNVEDDAETYQIKLFRVPKHIRDFIGIMITENEKDEILKNACNLYFGSKWREGSIKNIHSSTIKTRSKYLNIDNCQLIVRSLLAQAINNQDEFEIERSATLAVNYCEHILDMDDYKNSQMTSEEVYNLLKNTKLNRLKATITKVLGKSLRMNGITERSILVCQESLDMEGNQFSNIEINSLLTNLAYAHMSLKQYDKAIECAKKIEKTAGNGSSMSLTAKYIIAESTLKGEELLGKLRTLERSANKINAKVLADNISINIAADFAGAQEKEKRLTKIVKDGEDEYNTIRAVVAKCLNTLENSDEILDHESLQMLNMAYTYLYGQRMSSLFHDCHRALWLFCVQQRFYPELLNLFRHSSFVWRITGQEDKEQVYFNRLLDDFEPQISTINSSPQNQLSLEYLNRRKLEIQSSKLLKEI
uniref:metallophosphoesterase n=1 Tax=Pedobacter schmidteae TaxID=2201271 RepID=UPI000EB1C3BC|nr:metallophosphoesterase [Pedobacter schmidteae]